MRINQEDLQAQEIASDAEMIEALEAEVAMLRGELDRLKREREELEKWVKREFQKAEPVQDLLASKFINGKQNAFYETMRFLGMSQAEMLGLDLKREGE